MVPKTQTKELDLKQELDHWVKDFEKKIERTSESDNLVKENKQNIDYNYELIKDLQKQINELKQEIKELKHFSFVALKSRPLRDLNQ